MNARFANILGVIMIQSALLLSTPVKAETESPEFRACMDAVDLGAFKNSQWIACYEAELMTYHLNQLHNGLRPEKWSSLKYSF